MKEYMFAQVIYSYFIVLDTCLLFLQFFLMISEYFSLLSVYKTVYSLSISMHCTSAMCIFSTSLYFSNL